MMNMPPIYNEENSQASSVVQGQERQMPNPPIQQARTTPIAAPSSNIPEPCICPYCHQSIVTRVEKSNGLVVWLVSAGCCLFGCVLGCCLIPFFIDGIKDTTHYCPNCNRVLGRNKKL